MGKYFEIKPGTKVFESAKKTFSSLEAWLKSEVIEEFEQLIGASTFKNLEINSHILRLNKIPDGTKEQFKKGIIIERHEAKAKSEINKKYLAIVKKYKLIDYGMTEFLLENNLRGFVQTLCPIRTKDDLRFFVETKDNISDNDIGKLRDATFLIETKESIYLKIRAKMLEEKEDGNKNGVI